VYATVFDVLFLQSRGCPRLRYCSIAFLPRRVRDEGVSDQHDPLATLRLPCNVCRGLCNGIRDTEVVPPVSDRERCTGDAIAKSGHGVLLRLFAENFINPSLITDYLTALLGVLKVSRNQTDIVIDLGFEPQQIKVQQLGAHTLSALPFANEWRTITLASGCFPEQISNLEHGKWWPVPRTDWLGWAHVRTAQVEAKRRLPAYGDYGVRCGGIPKDIPNPPEPNIRYSDKGKVLVRRGPKKNGTMKLICASLVALPEFSKATFSEGDRQIAAKAATQGSGKNGSPAQWIQWCGNHHLELTASQIRSLPSL